MLGGVGTKKKKRFGQEKLREPAKGFRKMGIIQRQPQLKKNPHLGFLFEPMRVKELARTSLRG